MDASNRYIPLGSSPAKASSDKASSVKASGSTKRRGSILVQIECKKTRIDEEQDLEKGLSSDTKKTKEDNTFVDEKDSPGSRGDVQGPEKAKKEDNNFVNEKDCPGSGGDVQGREKANANDDGEEKVHDGDEDKGELGSGSGSSSDSSSDSSGDSSSDSSDDSDSDREGEGQPNGVPSRVATASDRIQDGLVALNAVSQGLGLGGGSLACTIASYVLTRTDTNDIKKGQNETEKRLTKVEKRLTKVEKRQRKMKKRQKKMEKTLGRMEAKLDLVLAAFQAD